jgi:hypothetical protein
LAAPPRVRPDHKLRQIPRPRRGRLERLKANERHTWNARRRWNGSARTGDRTPARRIGETSQTNRSLAKENVSGAAFLLKYLVASVGSKRNHQRNAASARCAKRIPPTLDPHAARKLRNVENIPLKWGRAFETQRLGPRRVAKTVSNAEREPPIVR